MESVTLCDLLQNWPEVEKRLATEGELTVTRDGMAVALLTSPRPARVKKAAKRFDSAVHAASDPEDMERQETTLHNRSEVGGGAGRACFWRNWRQWPVPKTKPKTQMRFEMRPIALGDSLIVQDRDSRAGELKEPPRRSASDVRKPRGTLEKILIGSADALFEGDLG